MNRRVCAAGQKGPIGPALQPDTLPGATEQVTCLGAWLVQPYNAALYSDARE